MGPCFKRRMNQAAVMLNGAAGLLVGLGSDCPSARALARRYISLFVAPLASIAAATTVQLRISVVIVVKMNNFHNLATTLRHCEGVNRQETEQQNNAKFASYIQQSQEPEPLHRWRCIDLNRVKRNSDLAYKRATNELVSGKTIKNESFATNEKYLISTELA